MVLLSGSHTSLPGSWCSGFLNKKGFANIAELTGFLLWTMFTVTTPPSLPSTGLLNSMAAPQSRDPWGPRLQQDLC